LTRMTPFSHIDQPGLSWRTEARREDGVFSLAVRGRQRKSPHSLFEAKALCRFFPEADRLPFIRPPLTVG
jgi:hypothetical protein